MRLVTFSKQFTHGADHATLSDVFVISATKDAYVAAVFFATQASGVTAIWKMVKRSTQNVGGVPVAVTPAIWDTNPASVAVSAVVYTTNPTAVGDQIGGDFRNTPFTFVNGQPSANLAELDFARYDAGGRGIKIGAGQFAALNVAGLTVGATIEVTAYVWANDA